MLIYHCFKVNKKEDKMIETNLFFHKTIHHKKLQDMNKQNAGCKQLKVENVTWGIF